MQAAVQQNSSLLAPISNVDLSPAQAEVVTVLAQGHSVTTAAREAGVHRTTVHHWLRHEPAFKATVQIAQREYVITLQDQMRELSARALEAVHKLIEDPNTPAAVRLKAALAVLDRPQFPKQPWHLPERLESPQEQEILDGLSAMEADLRAMEMADAIEKKQSAPVARSAPCPCGSGRKYKRCCAARPVEQALARSSISQRPACQTGPGNVGPPSPNRNLTTGSAFG